MARMTQVEKNEAYRKERKKLLQNVRRMKKRGYDVSAINIPEIPVDRKIRQSDIDALKKININRYKKATYSTYIWTRDEHGEPALEWKTYKGKKAQTMVRRRGAEQAVTTRREKERIRRSYPGATKEEIDARYRREQRQLEEAWWQEKTKIYDEIDSDIYSLNSEDFPEINGPSDDAVWDENAGVWREPTLEIDEQKNVYYMDIETGEVIDLPYGAKKPFAMGEYIRIMPTKERGEKMYETIMHDLDIMEQYQGNPQHGKNTKHDAITRENATKIKEGLEKLYNENRNALYDALDAYGDDIISVDYMYRAGGYQNYLLKLASAFQYRGYGFDLDEDEGDYDEGNFEY